MSDTLYRSKFWWQNTRQRMIDNGNSPWLLKKVVLRVVTGLLAIVGLALFASAIGPWGANFVHTKSPIKGAWQDALPTIPLLVSALYNLPVTYYTFWYARPAPLILEACVDSVVWALLSAGLVFSIWGGTFRLWQDPVIGPHGEIICQGKNMFSRECLPALYRVGTLELSGVVFGLIVWATTMFLLLHSCIEATRRRRPGQAAFMDLETRYPVYQYARPPHYGGAYNNSFSNLRQGSVMMEKETHVPAPSKYEFTMPRLPARAMPRYA